MYFRIFPRSIIYIRILLSMYCCPRIVYVPLPPDSYATPTQKQPFQASDTSPSLPRPAHRPTYLPIAPAPCPSSYIPPHCFRALPIVLHTSPLLPHPAHRPTYLLIAPAPCPSPHTPPNCFRALPIALHTSPSVSYTHLTLPTIYSV